MMVKASKYILIFTLILINIVLLSCPIAAAEDKTVEIKGLAYIEGDNLVKARKIAINDALRSGVEKAVGLYINAQTKTKNYQLINDNILKSSQGYVKNYQVLDEYIVDSTYYVKLEVIVSDQDLSKDLEALQLNIKRHGNPRVMLLFSQEEEHINLRSSIAETEIIHQFLKAGYTLIDKDRIEEVINQEKRDSILAGDVLQAAKLGEQLKADVVVVGTATANYINLSSHLQGTSLFGLLSYHSQLEAKIIKSLTAEIITAVTATGKGVGANREGAANKALLEGANNLAAKLIESLSKNLIQEGKTLSLKIAGIESLEAVGRLKNQLLLLSGVENLYFREYNEGLAIFDLDIDNGTDIFDLALELKGQSEFELKITRLADAKLTMEVQNLKE